MTAITNDVDFRKALDGLCLSDQRKIGASFVDEVLVLNQDDRVKQAINAARGEATGDVLASTFKIAKRASIDSHARCGSEGDWREQAAYFVARGAAACVAPEGRSKSDNIAWMAAINSRMARTCQSIDAAEDAAGQESKRQYGMLSDYLNH